MFGYCLYQGDAFCRLEIDCLTKQDAIEAATDYLASSGYYTRAEITQRSAAAGRHLVIGNINKELVYADI